MKTTKEYVVKFVVEEEQYPDGGTRRSITSVELDGESVERCDEAMAPTWELVTWEAAFVTEVISLAHDTF